MKVNKARFIFFSASSIHKISFFKAALSKSGKKTIKEKYETTALLMVMGYTYFFLGMNELIHGKKPYQPSASNLR